MNIKEFTTHMLVNVNSFHDEWEANHDWPQELEPGDWYDQFLIYMSTAKEDE